MLRYMCDLSLIIVLLSVPTMFSCEEDPTTGQCGYHTDCPIPERCIERRCRLECRVSTDCETGARCFEGVCYMRPEVCREDSVCAPFQEVCDPRTLLCVPPGELSVIPEDSPGGISGAGTTAGVEMTGGASTTAGVEMTGGASTTAGVEMTGGTSTTAGVEMTGGASTTAGVEMNAGTDNRPIGIGTYGDDCSCPSDCASGFCVTNKMKRSRTCSAGCDQDNDCPSIDTCLQAQVTPASDLCPDSPSNLPPPGSVVGVCVPNETSFPCGDPSECTSGTCLTPPQVVPWTSPQPVCTMLCEGDNKCPVGYRCGRVGGIADTVCVEVPQISPCPTGDALTCGGVCPPATGVPEEELAICLNGFNQQEGYCTCTCASANDCPAGFACSDIGATGDPNRPNVCIPFAGSVCPLSDEGVEQCLSTTCLVDEDDPSLNRCTAFCQRSSDCPDHYDCTDVGGGMVCVPIQR